MLISAQWRFAASVCAAAVSLTTPAATQDRQTGETGGPFREPEVRRSRDGVLKTSLDLRFATYRLAGRVLEVPTYEGSIPGPTLRLRPGDALQIHYTNNLQFPKSVADAIAKMPMPAMAGGQIGRASCR